MVVPVLLPILVATVARYATATDSTRPLNATVRLPLLAHTGTHHLQIWVGQPPVLQTLIVDTGSRLSAFVCEPCFNCGKHQSPKYYDPLQSSTSSVTLRARRRHEGSQTCNCTFPVSVCERSQCILQQHYTEGSRWTAYEVTDMVTLAGARMEGVDFGNETDDYEKSLPFATVAFTFGCQTKLTGLFEKQLADGILGLEYSDFSFISTLRDHGIFPFANYNNYSIASQSGTSTSESTTSEDAFSLCFTKMGGWMSLGGALLERHDAPMRLASLNKNTTKGMYSVHVKDIWVGKICLTCDEETDILIQAFAAGKGTIIDSGTTDTFLPEAIAESFREAWEEQTGRRFAEDERTGTYTEKEWKRLPVITLVLEPGNVNITISPENYMEPHDSKSGRDDAKNMSNVWSNRIYTDEPNGAVLGINAMIGHDILFDWKKGLVGIAPARC